MDGYLLEFDEPFDGADLDAGRWFPYYLPQWSSRRQAAARYAVGEGLLRLRIEADQKPWCPEYDREVRVSSLQTGVHAGPVGSPVGQHRFTPAAVVREAQESRSLYTPTYGLIEACARAPDDAHSMVALWMIGFEDKPDRSAEICIFEIFGREVGEDTARVGMGLHPFGDDRIRDDFEKIDVGIDVRDFHTYAAEWTPEHVTFLVDGEPMKRVEQSPSYPMQLMLGIYEFGGHHPGDSYPKEFVIDYVRGFRTSGSDAP